MKKLLLISTILTLCISCGRDNQTTIINEVVSPPTTEVNAETQDVETLLAEENSYRETLGQSQLTSGLSCNLQTYTGGDRIQASIANHNTLQGLSNVGSYTLKAPFNQDNTSVDLGLNVLPMGLKTMYKRNYLLRCTGYIVITENNYYKFDLTSDDASVLYIAGAKVIDNDNAHGVNLVSGTKFLRRGVHAFRLDYAQEGGSQALILNMSDELLSASRFVR